jgi:hypothetical protein
LPTSPGTEIKVTPDREAPIIPKATKNQGDCLSPVKKVSVETFLEVNQDIKNKIAKYDVMTIRTNFGSIVA